MFSTRLRPRHDRGRGLAPLPAFLTLCLGMALLACRAGAAGLPTLHLRQTATPPPMNMNWATLQDPAQAAGWYPSSPTWFGNGGQNGSQNHVEVLATYDANALYLAFLVIDRSPVFAMTADSAFQCDRNAVWIQTPQGRRFCFIPQLSGYYPAGGMEDSLEITNFTGYGPPANALPGWQTVGWTAGQSWQEMVVIPWSVMSAGAPTPGAQWRVNFVNYNQTSSARAASTTNTEQWAPGTETQPSQWGTLAFDEAKFTPPAVSPEATLTLRPATGFGQEVSLRPGDGAAGQNPGGDAAVTQSDWNDTDPIDYEIKEFLQFDLSMIPRDRVILGATLDNHYRSPFEGNPTDLYVHVERLAGPYDPSTVTMLTSPLPVENGDRELVHATDAGNWVQFDVSSAVAAAFTSGASKVSLALTGSSGDISNGKAWDWSWGRADWYDQARPRLHITFGKPGATFPAPAQVGSLNSTSVAGPGDKNKLTNGTFRYGATEGISNTTYWQDPGFVYVNGQNVPQMTLSGDTNAVTGDPAMRLAGSWVTAQQIATGLAAGRTYTLSAWTKASTPGQKLEIVLTYQDAAGNTLAVSSHPIATDSAWDQVAVTATAPPGTAQAVVGLKDWGLNSAADYDLYSDVQLEAGASPTAYSETMGAYYPNNPRPGGATVTLPVYRFYAAGNGEHFYTASAAEAQAVAAGGFYTPEGIIGYAPSPSATGSVPVYRLYAAGSGEHFYTASAAEAQAVAAGGSYTSEGVAFGAFAAPAAGELPLYRLYSPGSGHHFYTTSQAEHDALVQSGGWRDEGILGYLKATP